VQRTPGGGADTENAAELFPPLMSGRQAIDAAMAETAQAWLARANRRFAHHRSGLESAAGKLKKTPADAARSPVGGSIELARSTGAGEQAAGCIQLRQ